MREKHNEATVNRPLGERPIDARFLKIDIPFFISIIKQEDAWHKNDRNAITVFKTDAMCIVLVAIHKGAEFTYHVADSVASIQILDGLIGFHTEKTDFNLAKGEIVAVHDGLNYNIHAREESIILLTISYSRERSL